MSEYFVFVKDDNTGEETLEEVEVKVYPFEYQSWKDMGVTHFVTGCGTDRMYQECYYKYPYGKNPPDYVADIE